MILASWNVNSIKQRLPHVLRWLDRVKPDVLMLQELKGTEFPAADLLQAGYHSHAVTQKAYNGVAIISKEPITVISEKLDGDESDEQARYLEAEYQGLRIINIYLPNGNPVDTDKFTYKLAWMERLSKRIKQLRNNDIPFLIGGDFNVIPEESDCYDPKAWELDALFHPQTRAAFKTLLHQGLTDAFRIHNQQAAQYTFWDYQAGCWPANKGIRIDHFLLSPTITDKMIRCDIDPAPRGEEQPSDHTPILLEIEGF